MKIGMTRLLIKGRETCLPGTGLLTEKMQNVSYGCETWSLILRENETEGVSEQGAEENIWTTKG
jgi:hypothetical protein